MPANPLPGYRFERGTARYRDLTSGRFVSRQRIVDLLNTQISGAEERMATLTTALAEGRLAPAAYQSAMRNELRQLHIQNAAMGKGGFDRLTQSDYGRTGALLREDYARLTNMVRGLERGEVSVAQAVNRVQGYVGSARVNFFAAEREAMQEAQRQGGATYEERRFLSPGNICRDCDAYAAMGWQPIGVLPVPGMGSVCSYRCRCRLERREVVAEGAALERAGR